MDLENGLLFRTVSPRLERGPNAIFAEVTHLAATKALRLFDQIITRPSVWFTTDFVFKKGSSLGIRTLWSLSGHEKPVLTRVSGLLRIILTTF